MALRNCDTFVTDFQKTEDLQSKAIIFGGLKLREHGLEKAIPCILNAPRKQHIMADTKYIHT